MHSSSIKKLTTTGLDVGILSLLFLAIFARFIFTDTAFATEGWTDIVSLTRTTFIHSGTHLVQGILPLWNPYTFCGYPHQAMPSSSLFYPATFLYGLFAFPVAIKMDVLGHLWLVGVLSYLLARDLVGNRVVAIVTGAQMMTSAWSLNWISSGHIWGGRVAAWLALDVLLLRRFLRTGDWRWGLGLSCVLTVQSLAGGSQHLMFVLLVLGFYTLFELLRRWLVLGENIRGIGAKAVGCLSFVALGLAMSAIQLLPSAELVSESVRGEGISLAYYRGFGYIGFPDYLWYMFVRDLGITWVAGPLLMSLIALALLVRGTSERFTFLALGVSVFVYFVMPPWLYDNVVSHLPVLSDARGPSRMIFATVIVFFALNAYALKALFSEDARTSWLRWVVMAIIVDAITVYAAFRGHDLRIQFGIFAGATTLLAVASCINRVPRKAVIGAMAMLVIAESALFHLNNVQAGDAGRLVVDSDVVQFTQNEGGLGRTSIIFKRGIFNAKTHVGDLSVLRRRGFGGYHALVLDRLGTFLDTQTEMQGVSKDGLGRLTEDSLDVFAENWITPSAYHVLDLLNIRHVLTPLPSLDIPREHIGASRRFKVSTLGELMVYENQMALPVAFAVHDAQVVESDEEALKLLKQAGFPYRTRILLTQDFDVTRLEKTTAHDEVEVVDYGVNHVDLKVDMASAGFVVLTDMYYPGWKAVVDETEQSAVYIVDTILRGVFLDKGAHTVHFYYLPDTFVRGASISVAALITWLALMLFFTWKALRKTANGDGT